MALNKIKPLNFKHLKALDKEQLIPDGGNLYVRVRALSDGGAISFRVFYRYEGKQKWLTLTSTDLPSARSERDSISILLKSGIDPNLERALEKERTRQQQIDEHDTIQKLKARITTRDMFVNWCETDLKDRKDLPEIIRMFNKDVLPDLGDLCVEDVRKGHISVLIGKLKKRGVNHLARNLLKLIRQMFRFAVTYDIIEFDPTASLSIAKMTTKPTERDRTLSENEIKLISKQLPEANLLISTECAIWITLSTLCRIGELSKTKLIDIDFENAIWKIPMENSKNNKPHKIYLSSFTLNQFLTLKTLVKSDWLFTNRSGTSHVSEKSITKQISSRQTETILVNRSKDSQALALKDGKWTPHDLRRTGATMMGNLGIAPDVIEKCLNHTEENKIKRIYQRQKLEVEQAEAWKILGERLDFLINDLKRST